MKTRELKELHIKPTLELVKLLKESRERLQTLRFDLAQGKVKNVSEIRARKKDIARVLTILNSRHDKK